MYSHCPWRGYRTACHDELRSSLLKADAALVTYDPAPRILFQDDFDAGTHGWLVDFLHANAAHKPVKCVRDGFIAGS